MPNFDLKIEKAKKPETKDAKKDEKKEAPKPQPAKKEKSQKEASKLPKIVDKKEAAAPPKKWSPPELKFNFYDFKTEFVNSKDKSATLQSLYQKWEPEGLSIWYLQYQKFDASEGA